ncbi:MAG: hypothetical protein ACJ74Z_19910 [Bryobacteraceae bacterium]|jgi:hypothetical protein
MKQKTVSFVRASAPLALLLAFSVAMNAQSLPTGPGTGNVAGLGTAMQYLVSILSWVRNAALFVFIGALIWGCMECVLESWREGRPRIFSAIICAIIAGVAQAFISGIYSANG